MSNKNENTAKEPAEKEKAPKPASMADGKIVELDKHKEQLFEDLKQLSGRLRYKIYEAKALVGTIEQKSRESGVNAKELRRRRRILEFKISTEAHTLQKERELMKQINETEKDLEKAKEVERLERKLQFVNGDIRGLEEQINKKKEEITSSKSAIRTIRDEEWKKVKEDREKAWLERQKERLLERDERRKHERDKELAPFMGGVDDGVDLGTIAVFKKKNG